MLTVNNMQKAIGEIGLWNPKGTELHFAVKVIQVKSAFGRVKLLIKPRDGSGEQWVEESRLAL